MKLMMKDQPCFHPSSRVCSCHLPPAFSSASCFACGSSKLPSWGFPCLSCHSDRSIFAGDLMKAKLGSFICGTCMRGCTSAHPSQGRKGDSSACAEEIQDLFKKGRVAFIFKREIGLCDAKCGFPFISARSKFGMYHVLFQMPWCVLITPYVLPLHSPRVLAGGGDGLCGHSWV